ncbi:MAG: heat-inducible transcription repressor HrcA [Armatimonadetes bacterium]|nr:heat-inducible transcription repressor HrcA [Armatimonadota bacterium]
MNDLDQRKRRILRAIVQDYVATAEPVGSETLVHRYHFEVKPATIRNEMSEMSEMGYLRQPHTSAGRVPSDMGYRFYVDRLMMLSPLPPGQARQARLAVTLSDGEVEAVLRETCRILTELTSYAAVATPPRGEETRIKRIQLMPIAARRLMVIVLLNNGHLDHRLVEIAREITPDELMALAETVNRTFTAQLTVMRDEEDGSLPPEVMSLQEVYRQIARTVNHTLRSHSDEEVYIEGASRILRQPEFKAEERLDSLLRILEDRQLLHRVLSRVWGREDVMILIGSENAYPQMQDYSFVASRYRVGERMVGAIGIFGPTRMDYDRAVPAVCLMAQNLGKVLTRLTYG